MNLLKGKKTVSMLGIGGIGMSGLARLLHSQGIQIEGFDSTATGITQKLQEEGISVKIGAHALPEDCELVIFSEAVPTTNSARLAAKERDIPELNYFQALGEFTQDYQVLAISGSHGKSTTTAMLALILQEAGLDPTVLVGTNLKEFDSRNVRIGKGEYFVVEACEYRRNFLSLNPSILGVLNMEWDHTDYFKSFADYQAAFEELAASSQKVIWPKEIQIYQGKVGVPGKHNLWNAGMAAQIARQLGASEAAIQRALENFKGTWRRFEHRGQFNGAEIIDDYAHHPTEIKATLAATREAYPDKTIIAVFEPHQYSRTRDLLEGFSKAFIQADEVIIPSIYEVRDSQVDLDSTSPQELADEISKHHAHAHHLPGLEKTAEYLRKTLASDHLLLVMGAGSIDALIDLLIPKKSQ